MLVGGISGVTVWVNVGIGVSVITTTVADAVLVGVNVTIGGRGGNQQRLSSSTAAITKIKTKI